MWNLGSKLVSDMPVDCMGLYFSVWLLAEEGSSQIGVAEAIGSSLTESGSKRTADLSPLPPIFTMKLDQ